MRVWPQFAGQENSRKIELKASSIEKFMRLLVAAWAQMLPIYIDLTMPMPLPRAKLSIRPEEPAWTTTDHSCSYPLDYESYPAISMQCASFDIRQCTLFDNMKCHWNWQLSFTSFNRELIPCYNFNNLTRVNLHINKAGRRTRIHSEEFNEYEFYT